jgi:hypothetical protein
MIKPKAEYYQLAAYTSNHLGKEAEELQLGREAKKLWESLLGRESPEFKSMEGFLQNPKGYATCGLHLT